ncbi:MAG: 23S rRNA (adenine(2503)-C(2))-methyltransferase RlmN [Alphaproteobacteria bacterium]|nr:23S rRNA (adenine(2503)-C(2))-methyltransferase RlmN [Alphaproteobacteria bacterium]
MVATYIPVMTKNASVQDLIGLDREELAALLVQIGEKPFRVKQLWHWLYYQGASDFAAMTSLGKNLRQRLQDGFIAGRPGVARDQQSVDGTRKWLLGFEDGNEAETVYIPDMDEEGGALCVSTQVGCTLTCRFCHTGTQLLVRNLEAREILGQFMSARDALGEWPTPTDAVRKISNIVVMGMGEPLFNYDALKKALLILMDNEGLAMSRRRITVSTSGVAPMISRLGAETGVNLAISLHAVTDELRDQIMPINKKYPLAQLMTACRNYPGLSNARRITFEYLMLKGLNDSLADAKELLRLVGDIPAKFNLIPFNPWPGAPFETPSLDSVKRFSDYLFEQGYSAPIRRPRGQDILAACGQLRSESVRERQTLAKARLLAGIEDDQHEGKGVA